MKTNPFTYPIFSQNQTILLYWAAAYEGKEQEFSLLQVLKIIVSWLLKSRF